MAGSTDPHSSGQTEQLKGFDAYELRLGDEMRGERATLGKSLLDVQRELKIKANYIAAIENADPGAFESKGFIAGYVRSYARYLRMEPEEAFQRFCRESGFETPRGPAAAVKSSATQTTAKRRSAADDPLIDSKTLFTPERPSVLAHFDAGALGSSLVLVGLIVALGYGGWSVLQQVQKVNMTPVEQAPGVIASVDPLVGAGTVEDPDTEAEREAALVRLYRPQALDVPVLEARDGPIANLDPRSVGVLAAEQARLQQTAQDSLPTLPAEVADVEPVQVVGPAAPELAILAASPAWVRVSGADGSVLFEKILEEGERFVVPATEEPPILRAGNAGSIYFAVNGETFGPAADGAAVAKNVELSVEAVQQKYQMADLSSDPDMAAIVALAKAPLPVEE